MRFRLLSLLPWESTSLLSNGNVEYGQCAAALADGCVCPKGVRLYSAHDTSCIVCRSKLKAFLILRNVEFCCERLPKAGSTISFRVKSRIGCSRLILFVASCQRLPSSDMSLGKSDNSSGISRRMESRLQVLQTRRRRSFFVTMQRNIGNGRVRNCTTDFFELNLHGCSVLLTWTK